MRAEEGDMKSARAGAQGDAGPALRHTDHFGGYDCVEYRTDEAIIVYRLLDLHHWYALATHEARERLHICREAGLSCCIYRRARAAGRVEEDILGCYAEYRRALRDFDAIIKECDLRGYA
jgi:hypothetical protein